MQELLNSLLSNTRPYVIILFFLLGGIPSLQSEASAMEGLPPLESLCDESLDFEQWRRLADDLFLQRMKLVRLTYDQINALLDTAELDKRKTAWLNSYLVYCFSFWNEADSTERVLKQSNAMFREIEDDKGLLRNKIYRLELMLRQDDYTTTLSHLQSFYSEVRIQQDSVGDLICLLALGFINGVQVKSQEALAYYRKALGIVEGLGWCGGVLDVKRSMGTNFIVAKMYDSAQHYLEMTQSIMETCTPNVLSTHYTIEVSLMEIDFANKKSNSAIARGEKCVSFFESVENYQWASYVQSTMSKHLYEEGQFDQALKYGLDGLKTANTHKLRKERGNNLSSLYAIYEEMGDFQNAFRFYVKFRNHQDSFVGNSVAGATDNFESELMHQAEAYELKLNQQKAKQTRNIVLLIGLGILIAAGGLYSRLKQTAKNKKLIEKEKEVSEGLLLNILPPQIAEELKTTGYSAPRHHEFVTVIFTDFSEFTSKAGEMTPKELVGELHECFSTFDNIVKEEGVEKIKTIGDAYMAVAGLDGVTKDSPKRAARAALRMQAFMRTRSRADRNAFEMRVGLHSGPVVAGIVGNKKFQYDLWGDTVNIASRMESHCPVGEINLSARCREFLGDEFICEGRAPIVVKGKGEMKMYKLSAENPDL